jgi:hypothetical protein
LPSLQTESCGQTIHRFKPELFLSSGFDLPVEFLADAGNLGELLLCQAMTHPQLAQTQSK